MALLRGIHFRNIRGDVFGGITAAVVALPLALAFGVSSGAGPIAGIYGAIFVGFFASLFGGTPAQVSGPTGPMTVVMAAVFTQFSAIDPVQGPILAFTVVLMSGFFQVLFGLFRLGKYITLMPFPVISGFMSGIGVIIIILELAPLLGHSGESSVIASLQMLPANILSYQASALLLGVLTLLIVFLCPKSIAKIIPSPLIALCLGTLIYVTLLPEGSVPVIGSIPSGLPEFIFPSIDFALLEDMLLAAIMLAALGSIDSLLTSLVADNIVKEQHDSDRELIGQGVGNMMAGLFGGLPGAGATMRTVINIRAGGQTPLSGAVHAIVLLLIVLGAGSLAEDIPHAVLAGILIKVGIDIIDWNFLKRLHRAPVFVVVLMLLVFGLTVFVDLVTAVIIGVFIANVITIKHLSDIQIDSIRVVADQPDDIDQLSPREKEILVSAGGKILLYHLEGPISYASVKGMTKKLTNSQPHDALMFDFTSVPLIDVSTAMAIENIMVEALTANRSVYMIGINGPVRSVLSKMQILNRLADECLFDKRIDALEAAYQRITLS
ncbi:MULTISPECIES: SulP family inorganic anion transporter [unclassified Neptuniibacter]|uniref:SulP family inorganic anion transporter n=1 Tax=unclassified Neptuniibacter TaxID=2630693 RepID=UPI0026E2B587|nr:MULTISPECIES: SulP family inorganic anion transporter [unclassified Neptuniibacter]MDO6513131.1 SulP family inorganic anion transporter [Neptuniibacter sp. 2_MG-2023]MDO6592457.1 SulP family inorganic anion transporter [Neptuniibacter sp. 1_MG-2023]